MMVIDGGPPTTCCLVVFLSLCLSPTHAVIDYGLRIYSHENYLNFGYIEISLDGIWYSIHPDFFDRSAAVTACRQLGFDRVCRMEVRSESTRNPTSPNHLNQSVDCSGTELSLSFCTWGPPTPIPDDQRVLLQCANSTDVELGLFGGIIPSEGTPRMRCSADDQWLAFCGGVQWDLRDCHVMCRQLGYETCARWRSTQSVANGNTTDVISANLYCGFEESHILDCDMSWKDQCDVDNYGIAWTSCTIDINISGTESYLCGSDHTCVNQCGRWKRNQGCNCDEACTQFNDCCFDFEDTCLQTLGGGEKLKVQETELKYSDKALLESLECIHTGLETDSVAYYLIARCPPGVNQPGSVQLCEENLTKSEDMFLRTPVYDQTGIVFKNVYCAICHGRKVKDVEPWTIFVTAMAGIPSRYDRVFEMNLPQLGVFELAVSSELGEARFCGSHWDQQKLCPMPLTATGISPPFDVQCLTYFAPVSIEYEGDVLNFRNIDCIFCADISRYLTRPPPEEPTPCVNDTNYRCHRDGRLECTQLIQPKSLPDIIKLSLNFSYAKLDQYLVNADKSCLKVGETYDPFLKMCRLLECPNYLSHVGSNCVPSSVPDNFEIKTRLSGGDPNRGFVQILHPDGKWYTAVDSLFNDTESTVLCRQLGLDFEPLIHVSNESDSSELYTMRLSCKGSETSLSDCDLSFSVKEAADLNSSSRVYSRCLNKTSYELRLHGGILPSEGFVQLRYADESEWFYINGDTEHWDIRDGTHVCWELNFTYCASTGRLRLPPLSEASIIRRDFFCDGRNRNEMLVTCPGQAKPLATSEIAAWVTCALRSVMYKDQGDTFICGSDHTCRNRCGGWHGWCNCDVNCRFFEDCCDDFLSLCQTTTPEASKFPPFPQRVPLAKYSCINPKVLNLTILAVTDCGDEWRTDEISSLCKSSSDAIIHNLPVYDNLGVVYRNRFCALCNAVPVEEITSFRVTAPSPQHVRAFIPETGRGIPRRCFKFYTCEGESSSECSDNYWPVYQKLFFFSPTITLRNIFCGSCFTTIDSQPSAYCNTDHCPKGKPEVPCMFGVGLRGTSMLFSTFDELADFLHKCDSPFEVSDPLTLNCIFAGCPHNYFYHSGMCKKGTAPYDAPQFILTKPSQECYQCMESFLPRTTIEPYTLTVCSLISDSSTSGPFTARVTVRNMFDLLNVLDVIDSRVTKEDAKTAIYHQCGAAVIILALENDVLMTTKCTSNEDASGPLLTTADACGLTTYVNVVGYEFDVERGYYSSIFVNDSDICWRELVEKNLACSPSQHEHGSEDGTNLTLDAAAVVIPDYLHSSLKKPPIMNRTTYAWICTHVNNGILVTTRAIVIRIGHVTMLGATFSCLLSYLKFPQLRNVAGNCQMNLLLALSLAYMVSFIKAEMYRENAIICQILAASSQYVYGVCVLWVFIPYYRMASQYKIRLNRSAPFNFRETGNTFRYVFFAWGIPFAETTVCAFISACDCTPGFDLRYHDYGGYCFVGGDIAFLVVIILPYLVMLSFVICYCVYSCIVFMKIKPLLLVFQKATGAYGQLQAGIVDSLVGLAVLCIVCVIGITRYITPSVWLDTGFSLMTAFYGFLISSTFLFRNKTKLKELWSGVFLSKKTNDDTQAITH